MPTSLPMPTKAVGDVFTTTLWNASLRDNINKLLNQGHRVLTVAQFGALTGLEGTKGTVAPDEVYLEVDSANGIQWHLAYESGETTYKWRFLGGPPMISEVATSESTASTTYAALTTAGPAIAIPRTGDYDVDISGYLSDPATVSGFMSYDIGGTGAVDADCITLANSNAAVVAGNLARRRRKVALGIATLTSKYKTNTGTATFRDRQMQVLPVRLV